MSRPSTSCFLECLCTASWRGLDAESSGACFYYVHSRRACRGHPRLLLQGAQDGMPGTWPGMTAERQYANATHHPASAIQHSLMAGHSRPKDGVLSHAYVPASRITDSIFKQPSSNSQVFQTAMRHHPYCLARPRVGPSSRCLPSKMRGMARQGAQPLFLCARIPSRKYGAPLGAPPGQACARPDLFAASSFLRRAALFVAARDTRDGLRQPAPGGRPLLAARRSPGAARVRALRGTPAGAASDPTPHDAS